MRKEEPQMAKPKVYIDGKEGTTGLQIYDRLAGRSDIELLLIEEEKRKTETDNKSEFNKTKKKMIVVLAVSIVSVIAAIGIACGCKFL